MFEGFDYSDYRDEIDKYLHEDVKYGNQGRCATMLLEKYPDAGWPSQAAVRVWISKKVNKGLLGPERLILTHEERDKEGNVRKTKLSRRDTRRVSTEGMVIEQVTNIGHASQNVKYRNKINWKLIFDELKERLSGIEVPEAKKASTDFRKYCAIVNIYDMHIDKLPVKPAKGEIGSLEDNMKKIDKTFGNILSDVADKNPEIVYFPIGSDLFHTNFFNSKTKKGTELEYYCNPEMAYATICTWMVQKILQLNKVCKKLVVIPIKGNHDEDKVLTMKVWMDIYFKDSDIEIVNEVPLRQRCYAKYGVNMFGFGHGDKEKKMIAKIPVLMSVEKPMMWAKATMRHFYNGDLHHGFEHNFMAFKDYVGCTVEFLRGAGVDDQYHIDYGWLGVPKTAYLDLWPRKKKKQVRIKYPV